MSLSLEMFIDNSNKKIYKREAKAVDFETFSYALLEKKKKKKKASRLSKNLPGFECFLFSFLGPTC